MIGASWAGRRKVTRLIRRWLLGTALLLALAATIAVFTGSDQSAPKYSLQSTVYLLPINPSAARACGVPASKPARYCSIIALASAAPSTPSAASLSAYSCRAVGFWRMTLYMSGCVAAGSSPSLCPRRR